MGTSFMLLILLGVPLMAAAILALVGDRRFAPHINIAGSVATCLAGFGLAKIGRAHV